MVGAGLVPALKRVTTRVAPAIQNRKAADDMSTAFLFVASALLRALRGETSYCCFPVATVEPAGSTP